MRGKDRRWYVMRVRPYRTVEDRINGSVVTFVDITARLQAEQALSRSEQQLRSLVRASSQVLYRMSPDWDEMRELVGGGFLSDTNRPDVSWLAHYIPEEEQARVRAAIRAATEAHSTFELEHRVRRLDGTIGWTLSRAIPVLDEQGAVAEWFGSASDVTARRRAEDGLRESEGRLRALIEGVPQLVWRAVDGGLWTWASPQWTAFTGQAEPDSHGRGWAECLHPDDRANAIAAWRGAERAGALEVDYRIRHAGQDRYRWFQTRATPVRDEAGRIVEWLGTSTDVDDLRGLQDRQAIMVAELQHRTRNLLAVARNVARRSIEPSLGRDEYDARLAALSRVQSFLSRSTAYSVSLAEIVQAELQAAGDGVSDRVEVDGAAVALPGESVQAVALAIHELATNAVKYGAIAHPTGRLSVNWRVEPGGAEGDGRRLVIDWRESGVAMPNGLPVRRGYGSELITRALPYQLRAETVLEFTPDGVRCRVVLPASAFSSAIEENFS